jgi:hypothetical protein
MVQYCSFFISLLSRFISLLSRLVVEDNSVSLVSASMPACGRQWTR